MQDNDVINATTSCKTHISHRCHPNRSVHVQIHADLREINGRHFLAMVDSFSGWSHVVAFHDTNTSTRKIIEHVRSFFYNVGAPLSFGQTTGNSLER